MAISQMDNGAPALVSTSMVPEAPIGGAPVTAPVEVIPSGSELSDYERLRRPLPRLLLLLAPLLLFLPGAYFHPPVERMLAAATVQNAAGMGLFLTDLFIFGCFWLVYFSSGWGGVFACQSLRTLLQRHSTQWLSPEDPKIKGHDLADLAAARREKAKTTMTSQAIFIAISVFIISSVSQNAALLPDGKVLPLDAALVILALSAAISSFTLLLISTDAAETMFNTFAKTREDLAIHRLYTVSARLKYTASFFRSSRSACSSPR